MFIQPNKQVGIPLYLQIAEQLKEMILQKELPSGAKMPSERTMASLIDVHRNTIKHAYNELKADGYIETHERKGYFVSDLGEEKVEKGRTYNLRWSDIIKSKYINRRIEEQFSSFFKKDVKYSFAGDIMHTREIGSEDLKRIIKKISSDIDASDFTITHRQGDLELRKEISLFLKKMNINAKAGEIQIVSETFQAIDYISSMILGAGDVVIVPETVCPEIIRIFSAAGAKLQSIKMDKDGIICEEVEKALKNNRAKLIYVEPDFAIPTGTVMSIERRKQLLQLSYKYNVPIIEEGGNAGLRHEGKDIPPIRALDRHDSVIYVYTFYYKIPSGLRTAFVMGNKRLINDLGAIIQSRFVCQDVISQYILKEYLSSGCYDKNLKQINENCKQKKILMYEKLEKSISLGLDLELPEGGVFLWGRLPDECNEKYLQYVLIDNSVSYVPGSVFFAEGRGNANYVRFCYYCCTEKEITEGINVFNKVFADSMNI